MARSDIDLDVDTREYAKAVSQLNSFSSRAWPDVANNSSGNVVRRAIWNTPIADASDIESLLGVVGAKVSVSKKTGKFTKRGNIVKPTRQIIRIINGKRREAGLRPLTGKQMESAAKKEIAQRKRSIGFLRSGWIPALNDFKGSSRRSMAGGKVRGRKKGNARIARRGHDTGTVFWNSTEGIRKQGTTALRRAFRSETRSLQRNVEKKVSKMQSKFGAKAAKLASGLMR